MRLGHTTRNSRKLPGINLTEMPRKSAVAYTNPQTLDLDNNLRGQRRCYVSESITRELRVALSRTLVD